MTASIMSRLNAKRFAPLDYPTPQNYNGLQAIFSHLKIPSEFIAERVHSVTHSLGWHRENDSDHGERGPLLA